jgi:hypothetical protein
MFHLPRSGLWYFAYCNFGDVDPDRYAKCAAWLGLCLTIDVIPKHSLGVKFLARVYSPNVWSGDQNTCCDIPRQLTKIHTSKTLPPTVTPVMKLLEKCRSYMLTDKHTPILGDYVRKVEELHLSPIEVDPLTAPIRAWYSDLPPDVQYINEPADWFYDYLYTVLPDVDLPRFYEWIRSLRSLDECLTPPLLQEPKDAKPTSPVVMKDEILPRGAHIEPGNVADEQTQKQFPSASSKNKKFESSGKTFEEWRSQKIAEGTWKDKHESLSPSRANVVDPTITPKSILRTNRTLTKPKTVTFKSVSTTHASSTASDQSAADQPVSGSLG